MRKLVIVESPNKIATIQKYLGDNYLVTSSVGHIVKMKTSGQHGLGIDMDNWEPLYSIDSTKSALVKELKKLAKDAPEVLIATDPDREGEAIGDNLVSYLGVKEKYKRIKYNEITKEAIELAIQNPGFINEDLVKSQKTRRMLDRIIGFRLSKLIASKITNAPTNASAGRVQSIALKLIIDREKEIDNFVPIKYSTIDAKLANSDLKASFYNPNRIENWENTWVPNDQAEEIFKELSGDLNVVNIKVSSRKEAKITPFKQATLYKRAGLAASTVQSSMQKLYEGFGDGGLISYPRTDSTRLSNSFITKAKAYIAQNYGQEYVSDSIKGFSGDQDAHEAIRPTDLELTPELAAAKYDLSAIDLKIYTLVYQTTLQAVMEVPRKKTYSYELENNGHTFKISTFDIEFPGYYKVIGLPETKKIDVVDNKVKVEKYETTKSETKPPARYNDGSLIEKLDNIKVGRPSTFSSTVSTLKQRQYVDMDGKALVPTNFGKIVLNKLITSFPNIINENYTAQVEDDLDNISQGLVDYKELMVNFWEKFNEETNFSFQTLEVSVIEPEYTGKLCPLDNSKLWYRYNKKTGQKFIACSGFPKCRYIPPAEEQPEQKRSFFRRWTKKKETK